MNLKQLEAFVSVADYGSFSKAARELYLTQPTISAHISSLEKELNARLLVRNTKEVKLSDQGKVLYQYAKQMIDLESLIHAEFDKEGESEKKLVTIAASTIPAQYILPEVLIRFNQKYPGKQVKIMETDSKGVVEALISHKADIGFNGAVFEKKHCKYIPFYQDAIVIIAPNTEKYRMLKESNSVDWIEKESFIMREEGSGTRKEAERQLSEAGVDVSSLNVIATIENQETIKRSVSQGMGISLISKLAAEQDADNGDLLIIPIPGAAGDRWINMLFSKNYQLPRVAERFIGVVKEMYGDH